MTHREVPSVASPGHADDVDEDAYLQANPDARQAGLTAVQHFLSIGKTQGRLQYTNSHIISAMREEKLKRLTFRRVPDGVRDYGQPLNFLTSQLISEFDIPEAPPVSANQYGGPFIEEVAAHPKRLCLNLGAGLRHSYVDNIVNLDIFPSYTTDVVAVGEDLPFESGQFDYVICAAVLEHTLRPWDVAREICRVLKPGGKILIDYPFLQAVHGYPHHYFNATPRGAISLFEERCDILSSTIEPNNHPIQTLWWLLNIWRAGLSGDDIAAFDDLRIRDILALPADRHLEKGYCTNLQDWALRAIPAGSTLVAQKKSDETNFQDSQNTNFAAAPNSDSLIQRAFNERIDTLKEEIRALRESRSWRLMAPFRAFSESWKRRRKA